MKKRLILVWSFLLAFQSIPRAQETSPTTEIVQAADDFFATLTAEQKQNVLYKFADGGQRARWSNFPTGFVRRGGISLKQMTPSQQKAAMKLLSTVLSPMGLEKVNEIREADDDFKANGSKRGPGGHRGPPRGTGGPPPAGSTGPGGPPPGGGRAGQGGPPNFNNDDMFGSNLYYISFLGSPSTTQPWMLQFGGHHLALNITIAGSRGVLTPTLTGAQPAIFQLNGKTVRPVGRESDKALALLQSLRDDQRKKALLSYTVADLVLGPGQDGKKIAPDGLKASAMDAKEQAMLLDLIAEWTGILSGPYAAVRMAQMKADLSETWFAWSGATTAPPGANITAYYRIQGPHLFLSTHRRATSRAITFTPCTATRPTITVPLC